MNALEYVKDLFDAASRDRMEAESELSDLLQKGTVITFRRSNMVDNHNARVISVSGRRVRIRNLFTGANRWIDVDDIVDV